MSSLTFTIIKPNAVAKGKSGEIIADLIGVGFRLRAMKMLYLSRNDAQHFYEQHRGKKFFDNLVRFMTNGAIIAIVLEHDSPDAVEILRELVGSTNPENAKAGSIRALYGDSLTRNAIHASDSNENAQKEWSHFFKEDEIIVCDYIDDHGVDNDYYETVLR